MTSESTPLLNGVIVPLVSPLKSVDELDVPALERLVEHVIAGGVHGLFLLGTCGEGVSLSGRVQRELVEHVCRKTDRRVPVLVCVTHTSPVESAALARFAADAGADYAVAAPPFYLPLTQAELAECIIQLVRQCPLPLVLYNMPELTRVAFEPETVRQLMDQPRIAGMKDSSGDLQYFNKICQLNRQRPDWSLLMGPEHLLGDAIALGGHGGVAGGANLFPRLFVDIYREAKASSHELEELVELASRLNAVYGDETTSAATVIKGLKTGLAALGIGNGTPAPPLGPLDSAQRERIVSVVNEIAAAVAEHR